MLSNRSGLLVCFKKDGFDVVDDKLGIEKTGAVDVPDVVVGVKEIDFEHVTKETTPVAVFLAEFGNGLVEVGENGIEVRL